MNKRKVIFRVLIYASLLFVLYYLIRFDYLSLIELEINYLWLVVSIALLFSGFVLSAISWKFSLSLSGVSISNSHAVISHGMAIFTKYIPGKVWVILGRASYVADLKNIKTSLTSFISLKEQLLFISVGLLISLVSTWFFLDFYWRLLIPFTFILLVSIIFIPKAHAFGEAVLSMVFRKEFELPVFKFRESLQLGLLILVYWLFWTIGYYLLFLSFAINATFITAFAFPLSASFGVLAIIFPGGIGVREGIMVAFLITVGVDKQAAISISVLSRLWFITGEVFIFILAITLKRFIHKENV